LSFKVVVVLGLRLEVQLDLAQVPHQPLDES
jgi:hypothetical protein